MKKFAGIFAFVSVVFLAACGDDGSSGKPASEKDGTASVPTYDDLAHCTKSHYGEIVFVEEEAAYFECTSEDWAEVDESKLDSLLAAASSSSEADEDKPKSSSSLKADSTETADVEKVEVDSITVKGFAQKGPFASGTAVTVYGLDSLLEKTKTKFTGKVSGDSGAFKVEKIVLPSQYALVEVSGYYQNEVTGKKTSGSKTTLSALVDLSEGKTVKANVNLFTDLEPVHGPRVRPREAPRAQGKVQRPRREEARDEGTAFRVRRQGRRRPDRDHAQPLRHDFCRQGPAFRLHPFAGRPFGQQVRAPPRGRWRPVRLDRFPGQRYAPCRPRRLGEQG